MSQASTATHHEFLHGDRRIHVRHNRSVDIYLVHGKLNLSLMDATRSLLRIDLYFIDCVIRRPHLLLVSKHDLSQANHRERIDLLRYQKHNAA